MEINLSNFGKKKKAKKRVGRGNGSGHGTSSCRGGKGQTARSGGSNGLKAKGFRRTLLSMPKFKGMRIRFSKAQVVLLSTLEKHFENNDKVTPAVLFEKRIIDNKKKSVKILAKNNETKIAKSLEISGCLVSKLAQKIIEEAGGKVS